MRLYELFEAKNVSGRTLVIFSGRFHPFHVGHTEVFRRLATKFGINNTYVITSGKVEPVKSPFTFDEKVAMMVAAGIPRTHIFQEISPYAPVNLIKHLALDPNKDSLVFAVGEKDMSVDPRFTFAPLKDGSPSYFQPYSEKNIMPFSSDKNSDGTRSGHGYIYAMNDVQFNVAGQTINSASQIRELYKNADNEGRKAILHGLYPDGGANIKKIKQIFDDKLV